jgi:long-chain fatty acid transport protein
MRRALALSAALVALTPASVRANEPDAYGLGSRSSAMAGAVGADAVDFSAGYYNPAGLAEAPGPEIAIGYVYAANRLAIDGRDTNVDPVHGLVGGVVLPGRIANVPFAFGLALHMPDDGLSRVKALRQEIPRWELYDVRSSLLYLAANLAVRPVKWLELGGGVAFLAATRGRFGISGKADVLSPYDSKLRHEVDADLTSIRYPQAGLRILLGKLGAVGLTYRGETKLRLALDARLQGAVSFAGIDVPLLYELESRTVDAFLPQQVALGLSFQRIRHLHVNLDVTWVNWSAYESPTAKTKAHLEAKPPPGTPVELPGDPKPTKVIPPDFEDRLVPRLGVEYVLGFGAPTKLPNRDEDAPTVEVPLRVGFAYERSPVPPQTGFTNFVDADRVTVTAGTGVAWNAPGAVLPGTLRLDVHAMLSVLPERVTKKSSPADFVGDYRASGTMLGMGASLGVVF